MASNGSKTILKNRPRNATVIVENEVAPFSGHRSTNVVNFDI